MLASSLREEAQATVSNKPGHRGEHEGNRKTIARGMPGLLRCTCGDYARVLTSHFAREAVGALGTRHSLRPLFLGERFLQKLGRIAPRECGATSLRGAKRRSNPRFYSWCPIMDCFASLAMTVPRTRHALSRHRPARPGDPVFQRRL